MSPKIDIKKLFTFKPLDFKHLKFRGIDWKIYTLAAILFFIIVIFGGWWVIPSTPLDIAVLNKTLPVSKVGKDNVAQIDYRKQYGFFWLLDQQKYKNPNTNRAYDYKTDYYGPYINNNGELSYKPLTEMKEHPDMVYLADAYGDENEQDDTKKGISYEDMSSTAIAHNNGATVVGESDIVSVATEDSVKTELESLFGITFGTWTGRYIYDMKDLTDIPKWALGLYEQQYGKQWDYSGSGILLVSNKGKIIVLEANKDFTKNELMTVGITDKFKGKYHGNTVNVYNWFELNQADYNTDVVAEFKFNLNAVGKEKFKAISDKLTFPAVTRNSMNGAPTYYMSGDFNDYVAKERFKNFLFSDKVYQLFSYDRPGDITNLYWNFYFPIMQDILKETKYRAHDVIPAEVNNKQTSKIQNGNFQILNNKTWEPITVKGFNINGIEPGNQPHAYTRNILYYKEMINDIVTAHGNCIRAYDLMPPEFYRAIYENNMDASKNKIYLLQNITAPTTITSGAMIGADAFNALKNEVKYVEDAVHGRGTVPNVGARKGAIYETDISQYLLGYIVVVNLDGVKIPKGSQTFEGKYISVSGNAAEVFLAKLCEQVYTYQMNTYKYLSPVGIHINHKYIPKTKWKSKSSTINITNIKTNTLSNGLLFASYTLMPNDGIIKSNQKAFAKYKDDLGKFAYGGFVSAVKKAQITYPALVDGVGVSTNTNSYGRDPKLNGISEDTQGNLIVRMLNAINTQKYLGGVISDIDDDWSACSNAFKPFVVSMRNNPLWKNMLDPAENTGIISVDPADDNVSPMILKEKGRMQEVQLYANEAYLYATILLDKEIDFSKEQFMLGFDTYQRNDGEYIYDKRFFANSLSGMEFVVKFKNKNSAKLMVATSYDRNKGKYSTKEKYAGKYDTVTQLVYGTFETSNTHFYQTGSTVRIRLPWSMLNFTDPSTKRVINDLRSKKQVLKNNAPIQTTSTNGMIFSVLIADLSSKDTAFIFPESKNTNGYKTFTWGTWDKVNYKTRQKDSHAIITKYFSSVK